MTNPLGLRAALQAFRSGTLSRNDYLSLCSRRADSIEPWLKAFTFRVPADHLRAADAGALAGIPVAVKDIIATAAMPTTNGSPIYAGHVPVADAPVVARIKQLGGTVFGKTVTTEFAWRSPGPTVNPWNPTHTPGGSSSGSAAAVAAGIVPLALGTQTVGSVVRPAAFCGVVGFKPSYGAFAREGVHPLAPSLDHIGVFTRSVDDAALAFSLLADADRTTGTLSQGDPLDGIEPLPAARFGIVRPPMWDRVSPEQNAAFETALNSLRAAGIKAESLELPASFWQGFEAADIILAAEAAAIYNPLIERFPDKTSPQLRALAATGSAIAATKYIAAREQQSALRNDLPQHLVGLDGVLTIPAPGEAPEGLDYTGDASFCALWTFLGVPALTIPIGRSARNLPLGLQVVGAFGDDISLLRAAKSLETRLPPFAEAVRA